MQFNELLSLLDPYHSAPGCQLDVEISLVQYRLAILIAPVKRRIEKRTKTRCA